MPRSNNKKVGDTVIPIHNGCVRNDKVSSSSCWVESPDGDMFNLRYIYGVRLFSVEKGQWDIVLRYRPSHNAEDFDIFYRYDCKERAEEDLAMIRSVLKPLRLRSFSANSN